MKHICPNFWASGRVGLLALLTFLFSCGEDRTLEYEELTQRDHWMFQIMQQEYLWGDELKELEWKEYFSKPTDFFSKLTKQASVNDTWSWCAIDTLQTDHHERGYFNHIDSYGFDFVMMTDPTGGTSRQYARIMTVYKNSPAERCGLQRGDFISSIDGTKFTTAMANNLKNGKARTLSIEHLDFDAEEGMPIWTESTNVEIDASEYVEDVPFPISNILNTSIGRVGYLMCNRLTEGPVEQSSTSTTYLDALRDVMISFSGSDFEAFVLDLRLCNDGTLEMARRLASFFVDESKKGATFATTLYNSHKSDENASIPFDDSCIDRALKVQTLYVITSNYTSGAAEWLIRGIRYAMGSEHVITIGQTTNGQIVMTGRIPSAYHVTLHPAVCYIADAEGDYDYAKGILPDIDVNEHTSVFLYPYGTTQEILLNTILTSE